MVRSVAGDLPEQVKNNQSVNMAAGNGGQEISQYSWFTVYEKKKFDSRWKRLEVEYCDAGMSEEQIAAMKEYDWAWFCSQRVFQNHTQPIPCEQYDEVCGQSQLFRKFASLSYQWDVDKIDQTRYGWLASVENEQLLLRLKKLSKKDLELLTLLFVDGYRQIDVARLWHCSRSAVAQRFKKIKKFLNNT